ncbi:hypothetical protein DRP43_06305 [candidate division TA06 bacterium]|uniref:AAA+ ATPase domain-containing protein n=1 Tax=candidate division TA06 bacterium TaxID=2250710 RepID=A0A660SBZ9_UNCT6|nr:MAG: hypothetical protein DRP43_06305 [candidate division TA06 bacterium]
MKKHQIAQRYIEGVVKGYTHSLILQGERGIGKTEVVFNTLNKLGLEEDVHYRYIANYITPKGLVQLLGEVNELEPPKLLIMDDIDKCLENAQLVGILKSSLWDANGRRRITWITSRERINFDFTGKIILIVNKLNKSNSFVKALADRGYYYELKLTAKEKIALMEERVKLPYKGLTFQQRLKVFNFIVSNGLHSENLSLRILEKGYNLFKISPNTYQFLLKQSLD